MQKTRNHNPFEKQNQSMLQRRTRSLRVIVLAVCAIAMAMLATPATVSARVQSTAALVAVVADYTMINAGESIDLSIRTNNTANHVWAVVDGNRIAATMTGSNTQATQRNWTLTIRPAVTQSVSIHAGVNNNTADAGNVIHVTVNQGANSNAPINPSPPWQGSHPPNTSPNNRHHDVISVREITAAARGAVTLEVITGTNATHTWVLFDNGQRVRIGTLAAQNQNHLTWHITYAPARFTPHEVLVSANTAYVWNNAYSRLFDVRLVAPFVPPTPPVIPPSFPPIQSVSPIISGVAAQPAQITAGEATTITIRTNSDVNHVWAVVDGIRVEARRSNSTINAARTWTLTVRPHQTQVIEVFANGISTALGAASRSVNITVVQGTPEITGGHAIWNSSQTQVQVSVTTNAFAEWVDVQVPGRSAAMSMTRQNNLNTNTITWSLVYTPPTGWPNVPIAIFAGDSRSGTSASRVLGAIGLGFIATSP